MSDLTFLLLSIGWIAVIVIPMMFISKSWEDYPSAVDEWDFDKWCHDPGLEEKHYPLE